jgi:hypothetical protein
MFASPFGELNDGIVNIQFSTSSKSKTFRLSQKQEHKA